MKFANFCIRILFLLSLINFFKYMSRSIKQGKSKPSKTLRSQPLITDWMCGAGENQSRPTNAVNAMPKKTDEQNKKIPEVVSIKRAKTFIKEHIEEERVQISGNSSKKRKKLGGQKLRHQDLIASPQKFENESLPDGIHAFYRNCSDDFRNDNCKNSQDRQRKPTLTFHDKIISEIQKKSKELDQIQDLKDQIKCMVSPTKPRFKDKSVLLRSINTTHERATTFKIIDGAKHLYYISTFDELCEMSDLLLITCTIPAGVTLQQLLNSTSAFDCWNRIGKLSIFPFLFYLMTIDQDLDVCDKCQKCILEISQTCYIDNPQTAWFPSTKLIAAVLLNYGCTIEEHCPVPSLFLNAEKLLSNVYSEREDISGSLFPHRKVIDMKSLALVFDLVEKLVRLYSDEDLAIITLLLSWLLLDHQIQSIQEQVQSCMLACIHKISEAGWKTKWRFEMCVKLCDISENPEDVLKLCSFLAPMGRTDEYGRMIELRKFVSFSAAQQCLNVARTLKSAVTAKDLYRLLTLHPLHCLLDDYKLLSITIDHIDCAVGVHIRRRDKVRLKKLSAILLHTNGKIADSALLEEQTEVKNKLIMLHCKWSALISDEPSSKIKEFHLSNQDLQNTPRGKKSNFNSVKHGECPSLPSTPEKLDQTLPDLHPLPVIECLNYNLYNHENQKGKFIENTPKKFHRRLPELSSDEELSNIQDILYKSPLKTEMMNISCSQNDKSDFTELKTCQSGASPRRSKEKKPQKEMMNISCSQNEKSDFSELKTCQSGESPRRSKKKSPQKVELDESPLNISNKKLKTNSPSTQIRNARKRKALIFT